MPMQIIEKECDNCGICLPACPVDAISKTVEKFQINPDECVDCETCSRICPQNCINGGPNKYLELRIG